MFVLNKEESYNVLGVDISPYSREEFYQIIDQRLMDSDTSAPPLFVVTVNPEIAIQTIIDSEYKDILSHSSINTADGVGISWAVNYQYGKKVDRITGSDSFEEICNLCAAHRQSVFLYGAMPGVAERTANILRERIPSLVIGGTYAPESPELQLEDLPADIQQKLRSASVVFVALGAPAQEKWIHNNLYRLPNCKLIIGIGGSFDFIAGQVKRAPVLMRKTGLEWAYRLYLQPSRWRRMMKLPLFAMNVILLKISNPSHNMRLNKG